MKNLIDYIEDCYNGISEKNEYNKEYYRGCKDAYNHLLMHLQNAHKMYSWCWRHKYLGYFQRHYQLYIMVKKYRKQEKITEKKKPKIKDSKKTKKTKLPSKKRGCPKCNKSENIRYVSKGKLICTVCDYIFEKGDKQ